MSYCEGLTERIKARASLEKVGNWRCEQFPNVAISKHFYWHNRCRIEMLCRRFVRCWKKSFNL